MGYLKGFFTTLGITYPSFLFIQIYLEGAGVIQYFTDMYTNGTWLDLMRVCQTAIMEPINVFFAAPSALRIVLAFLPWVFAAFVGSFFFRKKHAARGGVFTVIFLITAAEVVYYLVFQEELYYIADMWTEANVVYGFGIVVASTAILGVLSGLISPFKKDRDKITKVKKRDRRPPSPPAYDYQEQDDDVTAPYYMPTESPSRDSYMETQRAPVDRTRPPNCEYCGSYLDPDSEFCSVCGNRVVADY